MAHHIAALVLLLAAVESQPIVAELGVADIHLRHAERPADGLMRRESMAGVSEHSNGDLPTGDGTNGLPDGINPGPIVTVSTAVTTLAHTSSRAYATAVMASDPVGYWDMADKDSITAPGKILTSGLGKACGVPGGLAAGDPCEVSGEIKGSASLRSGLLPADTANQAMNFSGTDDEEVVIPDSAYINTNASGYRQRTVELWFKAASPGDINRTIYCEGNEAHSGLNMYVTEDDNDDLFLNMFAWDRGNHDTEFGTTLINPHPISCAIIKETSYYAVMQFDAENRSFTGWIGRPGGLEICGQLLDIPLNVKLRHHGHGGGNAVIGGIHTSSRASGTVQMLASSHNFKGTVDEVAIYNRALPESEIESHWTNGSTTTSR